MSNPDHYRAKAAEFGEMAKAANDPDLAKEFHERERSLTMLADNEDWLRTNPAHTVHAAQDAQTDTDKQSVGIERWDDDGGASSQPDASAQINQ
jgi:hypothetical protein